jgi:protein-tyrosine phosphatase
MSTVGQGADFYTVTERLLAGEYPYGPDEQTAKAKLDSVLEADVTCFVDLTEEGEHDLKPYAPSLTEQAEYGSKIEHVRMAIKDMTAPNREEMVHVLDQIDERLVQGHTVYVHCFGGTGRTGTVVGCWLARHGLANGQDVITKISGLRRQTQKFGRKSPEMSEQIALVTSWQSGE